MTPKFPVRLADLGDLPQVMHVLDGALLDTDASEVRERIERNEVFVANRRKESNDGEDGTNGDEPIHGALVLAEPEPRCYDPDAGAEPGTHPDAEIEAIAVRRRYRRQGIASALVARARRNTDRRLVAVFDGRVRAFYESLGFDVRPVNDDGRFRGFDTSDETP
jgi:ribosomal protein S18 acetylase RimI-like enzyme